MHAVSHGCTRGISRHAPPWRANPARQGAREEAAVEPPPRAAAAAATRLGDRTLAAAAALGERAAFETIVHRYGPMLYGYVRRMVVDGGAVDDVVQDTLVSVAGSIGQFGGDAKVTTWVHRIAQRRVVDHLRRQRTTAELTDSDLGPSARISSMIAARVTVRDAVERLPDAWRLRGQPFRGHRRRQVARYCLAAALQGQWQG